MLLHTCIHTHVQLWINNQIHSVIERFGSGYCNWTSQLFRASTAFALHANCQIILPVVHSKAAGDITLESSRLSLLFSVTTSPNNLLWQVGYVVIDNNIALAVSSIFSNRSFVGSEGSLDADFVGTDISYTLQARNNARNGTIITYKELKV